MPPGNSKPKHSALVMYRRILYVLLLLVSVIYVFYGFKKSPFFYYYFVAGGCLIIALLFKSYMRGEKLRRWLGKNVEDNYQMSWLAGSALFCLPYIFIMLQLLHLRKKTELYFCETKAGRARVVSSGLYPKLHRKRRSSPSFDYYIIRYTTDNGIVEQELNKEDAFFWGNEIPVRYSVANPDLFEVLQYK